jgi:bacterioferritin
VVSSTKLQANVRLVGYLGRALSYELGAVQQYMTHAALCENWGLAEPSRHWRQEAAEEMRHAERIIQHMLTLGVAPNASQLRPVRTGRTLTELVAHNLRLEGDIVALYSDATLTCMRGGDPDNARFFEQLLDEERAHARELQMWYESLTGRSGP